MAEAAPSSILAMPEVAELQVPSSLAPVKQVAPAAVLVVALCIFFATFQGAANDWWVGPYVFAIPVVTIAVALMDAGNGDRSRFWRVLLVGFVSEAEVGMLLTFILGLSTWLTLLAVAGAIVCFGLVAFALLPIMMAVGAYGSRTDLEAGDAMLAAVAPGSSPSRRSRSSSTRASCRGSCPVWRSGCSPSPSACIAPARVAVGARAPRTATSRGSACVGRRFHLRSSSFRPFTGQRRR